MRRAFTLVELIVVIAIIVVLAALIFPVFARAKASARQTKCVSNLSQIGKAIAMYMSDNDDHFPFAVDAVDKYAPQIWNASPEWQAQINAMPMIHEVLQPYSKNRNIFECPSDTGMAVLDNNFPTPFPVQPSLFKKYGSSYFFRTEIAFRYFTHTRLQLPDDINVMFDAAGHWHGDGRALRPTDSGADAARLQRGYRYTILFGDLHAKSVDSGEMSRSWSIGL